MLRSEAASYAWPSLTARPVAIAKHHIWGGDDGLACTRTDAHTPGHGCRYEADDAPQLKNGKEVES